MEWCNNINLSIHYFNPCYITVENLKTSNLMFLEIWYCKVGAFFWDTWYIDGWNFVGRTFRWAKLFVRRSFRHFSKNSSLSPDNFSLDKAMINDAENIGLLFSYHVENIHFCKSRAFELSSYGKSLSTRICWIPFRQGDKFEASHNIQGFTFSWKIKTPGEPKYPRI